MAERDKPGVEYIDLETKRGVVKTLSIRLYAPDGSLFRMPHGGDPLTYLTKGYKTKPDDIWREANRIYEEEQAESLKLSKFQGEIKNRQKALEAKKVQIEVMNEMKRIEAEMEQAENALNAVEDAPEPTNEVEADPAPAPEPKPKPKAKAKAKAKA